MELSQREIRGLLVETLERFVGQPLINVCGNQFSWYYDIGEREVLTDEDEYPDFGVSAGWHHFFFHGYSPLVSGKRATEDARAWGHLNRLVDERKIIVERVQVDDDLTLSIWFSCGYQLRIPTLLLRSGTGSSWLYVVRRADDNIWVEATRNRIVLRMEHKERGRRPRRIRREATAALPEYT